MTKQELSRYQVSVINDGWRCFLCGAELAAGDLCLLVPVDCDETAKKDAGQPYESIPAHQRCLEVP